MVEPFLRLLRLLAAIQSVPIRGIGVSERPRWYVNLWTIQPSVVTLLEAFPSLTGILVIADDGTYPKTPQREQALRQQGIVIIVWQIESGGLADLDEQMGLALHDIEVHVVIEENITVNRTPSGTNIEGEKALQYVLSALVGQQEPGGALLVPDDPPFRNFGKVNGLNQWVANLRLRLGIGPNVPG